MNYIAKLRELRDKMGEGFESSVLTDEHGKRLGVFFKDKNVESFLLTMQMSLDLWLELAEAAQAVHNSVNKVYSGYPGKLDWPELHALRQVLEKLGGET